MLRAHSPFHTHPQHGGECLCLSGPRASLRQRKEGILPSHQLPAFLHCPRGPPWWGWVAALAPGPSPFPRSQGPGPLALSLRLLICSSAFLRAEPRGGWSEVSTHTHAPLPWPSATARTPRKQPCRRAPSSLGAGDWLVTSSKERQDAEAEAGGPLVTVARLGYPHALWSSAQEPGLFLL